MVDRNVPQFIFIIIPLFVSGFLHFMYQGKLEWILCRAIIKFTTWPWLCLQLRQRYMQFGMSVADGFLQCIWSNWLCATFAESHPMFIFLIFVREFHGQSLGRKLFIFRTRRIPFLLYYYYYYAWSNLMKWRIYDVISPLNNYIVEYFFLFQWYKKCKNLPTIARVIEKNKVARFYWPWCRSVAIFSDSIVNICDLIYLKINWVCNREWTFWTAGMMSYSNFQFCDSCFLDEIYWHYFKNIWFRKVGLLKCA